MTASRSDLRVVPAAVAVWAFAAALSHVRPGWAFGVVVAAALVGAVGWRRPAVAFPAVCLALVAACCGWRATAVEASPVAQLAERSTIVRAEVVVREDGRAYDGRAGPGVVVPLTVRVVESGERTWRVRVRVTAFADGSADAFVTGTRLAVRADLEPADGTDEAAVLRLLDWRVLGNGPWWWRWSEVVREGIRGGVDHRDDQPAALVPALVAGDDARLSEQTRQEFTRTGLTHLLAVSGANLTIVLGVVLLGLRSAGASRRMLLLAGALTVVAFVLVARPEPSVQRAAVMGSVALAGLLVGRTGAGLRALAWAVIVLLVLDPWLATRPGFVLSVCATAGIIVLAAPLARRLAWLPEPVAQAVAVPIAAHLACLPVVASLSGEVSLVAVFANVAAAPVVAPATVAGLAAGLVDLVVPVVAVVPGTVAWASAWVIVEVARIGAAAPGAAIAWPWPPWTLVPVALLVGTGLWRLARRPALAVGVTLGLLVAVLRPPTPGWPPEEVVVVACDVGQGDGFVVPTAPGEAIVIDVGEEPAPIDRCLTELGIDRIALLLFTHGDADHVDGWRGAVRGRRVDVLADGPSGGPDVPAGRRVRLVSGDRVTVGAVGLEVLWPRSEVDRVPAAARNDASVVVRATVRGHRVLFTADLGEEAQRGLARLHPDLSADVLKVAHHGSADHWPGLVERVGPSVALIGVGADNPHGHPAPPALSTLSDAGVAVWRTDRSGTVAVVERDGALAVSVR
ncbi:ComEC/Rec2 family competence protein [Aeromicrobium duanguangcaii]|uniref:ComEC/Rec2 family competence protein n=1 Tax=Aeromicrobium duanguangcaii TaxID=2968086 RepID=A0ABY5KHW5_9ACTN|nr:ComEC/Rec2 family competence protein [Aeromicrobium duanguangcaii]MCD9153477.1 ComEC/Rec2 family competence protein [Aeromicrobium duanguangcaii]UUI69435.1 ComEC/Rec2 family competence protein [Aeromicrobium duanguangcaii]